MTNTLYNPYYNKSRGMYPRPVVEVKKKGCAPYLYCSSEYGNLKTPVMSPADFGTRFSGTKCHNSKNKRK